MIILGLVLCNLVILASAIWLWPISAGLALIVITTAVLLLLYSFYLIRQHQNKLLANIEDGLLHILDGNYAISLPSTKQPSAAQLVALFNRVTDRLRKERVNLHQRELMLDKVINQSNILTILTNQDDKVVYANLPAVHCFSGDEDVLGCDWPNRLKSVMPIFHYSLQNKTSAICTLEDEQQHNQSWHISQSPLTLNGMPHQLYLFKPITEELSQQELETWKKAIRVISHELNNSLAPISSLCHSGKLIAEQQHSAQLDRAFNGISKRVNHLAEFVKGYSELAKVTAPHLQTLVAKDFLLAIQTLYPFRLQLERDDISLQADPALLEQALINLLKNAIQAATTKDSVLVSVMQQQEKTIISVEDDGAGIPEQSIHQVILPFYSTKADGTGVGLAICRNVVDTHHGKLSLQNKASGGLKVTLELPYKKS